MFLLATNQPTPKPVLSLLVLLPDQSLLELQPVLLVTKKTFSDQSSYGASFGNPIQQ